MAKKKAESKPQKVKSSVTGTQGSFTRRLILCILAIIVNVAGMFSMHALGIPLYLDTVGTIIATALGGGLPGIIVGFVTNVINGVLGTQSMYYGIVNMTIAVITALFPK